MHRFSLLSTIALCTLLSLTPAFSQTVTVVNSASSANQALPNGSIAQGSIFVGYGPAGMGPGSIALPTPWPFPLELGGTTIKVTVGGTTVDCFMVYSVAGQVAAILPSDTPLGAGTVAVMFNGSVVATGPINVVARSFGIFSINQQGTGPIVATDPLNGDAVYTTTNSAMPEGFIDIWGTGLGAVAFPDEGQPMIQNLTTDVKVYIAGILAQLVYAGRSGCCSAVDLIRVIAPAGVTGCYLPVSVVVGGIVSNYTTLAIDPDAGECTPDTTFGGPDLSQLQNGGTLRFGDINLNRQRSSFDGGQLQVTDVVQDFASATYSQVTIQNVGTYAGILPVTKIGACTVYQYSGENPDFPTGLLPTILDAGPQLGINGPGGPQTIDKIAGGTYAKSFSFLFPTLLTPESKEQFVFPTYYDPGLTTVTAPGGADVQAHMASITVPQDFAWTNKEVAMGAVNRNNSLTVTYQGTGFDFLTVFGFAPATLDPGNTVGAGFHCVADPAAGSFTIPA